MEATPILSVSLPISCAHPREVKSKERRVIKGRRDESKDFFDIYLFYGMLYIFCNATPFPKSIRLFRAAVFYKE